MKSIDEYTLYEILDVSANASSYDIRDAYKEILSIYDKDSLSTYSLFTPLEREKLLAQAESAFQTLSDTKRRAGYNSELLASGKLTPSMLTQNEAKTPVAIFQAPLPRRKGGLDRIIKEKLNEKSVREIRAQIQSKELISGQDLKSVRTAANIDLVDIFEASRVSVNILEAIEENDNKRLPSPIYLKGFLKSYAQFLNLEPGKIIPGYLAYLSRP
ncbi:MAG: helix-turn-helix domain-containing protein [Proteobacteria bacterium]|nr:helix-turn-helix domain-containing protein [Pseudomonadota bacterium]